MNNLFALDLIVCRNVMIYFGLDLMQGVIRQFHECLVPAAWLLVCPSEPNLSCFKSFRMVNAPGVTLYQKPDQPCPSPGADGLAMVSAVPAPVLEDVRRYADSGAWENAVLCCEQLLAEDNLNSTVHFYYALVLEQMRRHAEADRSLRRAIYLDRESVLPLYYLGLLLQSHGDPRHAAQSFDNALELLRTRRDAEVFAEADGITVAELKKLASTHLEILQQRV